MLKSAMFWQQNSFFKGGKLYKCKRPQLKIIRISRKN